MDRARRMLASERSVTEVCFEVGYGSLGSFSSKFRAQFGRSPAAFQREVRRIFGYNAPWRVLMLPECFLQSRVFDSGLQPDGETNPASAAHRRHTAAHRVSGRTAKERFKSASADDRSPVALQLGLGKSRAPRLREFLPQRH